MASFGDPGGKRINPISQWVANMGTTLVLFSSFIFPYKVS